MSITLNYLTKTLLAGMLMSGMLLSLTACELKEGMRERVLDLAKKVGEYLDSNNAAAGNVDVEYEMYDDPLIDETLPETPQSLEEVRATMLEMNQELAILYIGRFDDFAACKNFLATEEGGYGTAYPFLLDITEEDFVKTGTGEQYFAVIPRDVYDTLVYPFQANEDFDEGNFFMYSCNGNRSDDPDYWEIDGAPFILACNEEYKDETTGEYMIRPEAQIELWCMDQNDAGNSYMRYVESFNPIYDPSFGRVLFTGDSRPAEQTVRDMTVLVATSIYSGTVGNPKK